MRSRDVQEEIRIFVIKARRRRRHDDYFEVIPRVAIIFCRSLHVRIGKHSLPTGIDFTFDSLAVILFPCFPNSERPVPFPIVCLYPYSWNHIYLFADWYQSFLNYLFFFPFPWVSDDFVYQPISLSRLISVSKSSYIK